MSPFLSYTGSDTHRWSIEEIWPIKASILFSFIFLLSLLVFTVTNHCCGGSLGKLGGMETSWRRVDVMRSFASLGGEVLFKVQFFFFLSHLLRSFYFFFLMSVATITGGGKGNYTRWRSLDLKGERTSLKDLHMLGVKKNCCEMRGVEHGRKLYCSYRRRQSSKWWPLLSLYSSCC